MHLDQWKMYCQEIFDKSLWPDTKHWNMRYGGKHPVVTNVIYTNGDEDPWKHASILKADQGGNEKIYPIEIVCDGCAHCVDLRAPSVDDAQTLTDGRTQILDIFR